MTLNAQGGGTATTKVPLWGEIAEISCRAGTAFIGTGTITVSRDDGREIMSGAAGTVPWAHAPFQTRSIANLGSVGADAPIPVDGYMTVAILGGGAAATGTVDIYVR
jgi:hypothetical protein